MRAWRLIMLWFAAIACWPGTAAAAVSISVIQTSPASGRSVGAIVQFVADEGDGVTALQFDLAYDRSDLAIVVTAGAALAAPGKSLSMDVLPDGTLRCLITGINNSEIPAGPLVEIVVTFSPTARRVPYSLTLLNAAATTATGEPVEVDARSGTTTQATGFTDDLLRRGVDVIRAVHFLELRLRIDALRARHGLAAYQYSTTVIRPGIDAVIAPDLVEMRAALSDVYEAAAWPLPIYETQPARGDPIRAIDLVELRLAVFAIE